LDTAGVFEDARAPVESFAACLEAIRKGHKPVIGLVDGEAAGGGVGLAAACDGVLATTEATFTLSELLFGLTPAVILPYLAQRVSLQKLRWMGLTAGSITGQEAVELGLADAVCPPEKAPAILRSWIRKLRRIEPNVAGTWKRMTIQSPLPGSKDGVEVTVERLRDASVREKLRAFLESGEPPWKITE
jgi:enoyl-CoA hydratase/carnithine racemase